MESLIDVAATVSNVKQLISDNNDLKQRCWGQSKIKDATLKLDHQLGELKATLKEVSGIQFLAGGLQSCTSIFKKELLKEGVLKVQLLQQTAISLSQRIRVRVAQLRGKISPASQTSFRLLSQNGLNFSWDSAVTELEEADDSAFPGPLLRDELLECAQHLISCAGVPLTSLIKLLNREKSTWAFNHGCTWNLLGWLPLLAVVKKSSIVLLNLHEVVLEEQLVDDLVHLDCSGTPDSSELFESSNIEEGDSEATPRSKPGPAKGSGGRVLIHIAMPEIVSVVSAFAELHWFAAQSRRRNDIATTNGVSLQQIRTHLKEKISWPQDQQRHCALPDDCSKQESPIVIPLQGSRECPYSSQTKLLRQV